MQSVHIYSKISAQPVDCILLYTFVEAHEERLIFAKKSILILKIIHFMTLSITVPRKNTKMFQPSLLRETALIWIYYFISFLLSRKTVYFLVAELYTCVRPSGNIVSPIHR